MSSETRLPGARRALALLLAINLFNYIDRYILAAMEPEIRKTFFASDDPHAYTKTGWLATAFLVSYMCLAPLFGWLSDRFSRWLLVGVSVAFWSLASGMSGLAVSFGMLILTRVLVGVGEAGYGPSAPALLAEYFPASRRGRVMSFFYLAIPVGGALGYVLGGLIGKAWGWRMPFFAVTAPGVLLALCCMGMKEPRRWLALMKGGGAGQNASQTPDTPVNPDVKPDVLRIPLGEALRSLVRNRSFLFNTAAMTAMTFSAGVLSFRLPGYLHDFRGESLESANLHLGAITVVSSLFSVLLGGWLADRLQTRLTHAYFWVSGVGMLLAFIFCAGMIFTPMPYFWPMLFGANFFLFLNTGPANAALVAATDPRLRSTAFAVNIFLIHALGDAISPPLSGKIAELTTMPIAFLSVSALMAISGLFWIVGAKWSTLHPQRPS